MAVPNALECEFADVRRLEFVDVAQRGLSSMTEPCARYGIGRRVGDRWLARYEADNADGLADQRRVAQSHWHRMREVFTTLRISSRRALRGALRDSARAASPAWMLQRVK